jgi:hypothetical protein
VRIRIWATCWGRSVEGGKAVKSVGRIAKKIIMVAIAVLSPLRPLFIKSIPPPSVRG